MNDTSRSTAGKISCSSVLMEQAWQFSDLILKTRFAEALEAGIARYPIHRSLRYAACGGFKACRRF